MEKKVIAVGMSSPWMDNWRQKDKQKITKYGYLRWKLKNKYFRYCVKEDNIAIDVLGGRLSRKVELSMRDLFGVEKEKSSDRYTNLSSRDN